MTAARQCLVLLLLAVTLAAAEIKNQGWWKNTVFYQIYPRSFMDTDADGVGDLKGITKFLDHFTESGVGAIWLSPINRSPMVDFGYDISDFRDIDPEFGTLEDFVELIKQAKKLGLKVILDLVPNHTSDQHYWFQQSVTGKGKYKDYYVWADGKNNNKEPPNNWLSVFGKGGWTFNETRNQWYFHQFEYRQPDLNYSNPDVREEMEEIISFWLRKGIDGFRIDAVPHLFEDDISKDEPKSGATADPNDYNYLNHIYTKDHPKTYELVQSWRYVLDNYSNTHNEDEKVMMTEAYTDLKNTTKFYKYGSHIPFNFKFIMGINSNSNALAYKTAIDEWMKEVPTDGVANWVMGNHDRSRVATRYPGRPDQLTMLAMILPGVAVTYYGEEIGMLDYNEISFEDTQDPQGCIAGKEKYKIKSRDPCRTPFQWDSSLNAGFGYAQKTWLPVHTNFKVLNLANQKRAKEESHYKVYTTLTKLRKSSYALKNGGLKTVVYDSQVLAVIRDAGNETMTLLINFSDKQEQKVNLLKDVKDGKSAVVVKSVDAKVDMTAPVLLSAVKIPAKASVVIHTATKSSSSMLMCIDAVKLILLAMCAFLFGSNYN